jgi:hypothetical protein
MKALMTHADTPATPADAIDFNEVACSVIEGWAKRRRPQASDYRWVGKAPAKDWLYDEFSWTREISDIHREFERRIGFTVPLPPAEKRKTARFSLIKTQYLLVRKAETQSGHTVLKALLG